MRTLNLDRISDSQFSERVKSRVALARMARHEGEEKGADDGMRDGQIGLDVRPPVHQPPEIMVGTGTFEKKLKIIMPFGFFHKQC